MSNRYRRGDRSSVFDRGGSNNPQSLRRMDEVVFGAIRGSEREMMTVERDGSINLGGFTLTSTGLLVMDQDVRYDDWESTGKILARMEASIQWLVGDWFIMGERQWGRTYDDMAEILEREVNTIKDYAYVARHVQLSVRTDKLSFGHHKLVSAMEPHIQAAWLAYAVQNKLSIADMRKLTKAFKDPADLSEYNPNNPNNRPAPPEAVLQMRRDAAYLTDIWTDATRLEGRQRVETIERARRVLEQAQAFLRMMGEDV